MFYNKPLIFNSRTEHGGRLAQWHGPGTNWTIISSAAFVEVTGRANFGRVIYAVGWDDRSAILKVFDAGDDSKCSTDQSQVSHA